MDTKDIQKGKEWEQIAKKQKDVLPVRAYLDQTVVPLLIQALSELAKKR